MIRSDLVVRNASLPECLHGLQESVIFSPEFAGLFVELGCPYLQMLRYKNLRELPFKKLVDPPLEIPDRTNAGLGPAVTSDLGFVSALQAGLIVIN